MLVNIIVSNDYITQKHIDKLNSQLEQCNFSLSKRLGYTPIPPEILIIIFELIKELSFSATYDLFKTAILSLVASIDSTKVKETRVVIVNNGKTSEILLPFKVTKAQKDKLVDAAIIKLLREEDKE